LALKRKIGLHIVRDKVEDGVINIKENKVAAGAVESSKVLSKVKKR
jgi:hypothetical protein